jgi:hypothetical protein
MAVAMSGTKLRNRPQIFQTGKEREISVVGIKSRKVGGQVERRRTAASQGTGLISDQSRLIYA